MMKDDRNAGRSLNDTGLSTIYKVRIQSAFRCSLGMEKRAADQQNRIDDKKNVLHTAPPPLWILYSNFVLVIKDFITAGRFRMCLKSYDWLT